MAGKTWLYVPVAAGALAAGACGLLVGIDDHHLRVDGAEAGDDSATAADASVQDAADAPDAPDASVFVDFDARPTTLAADQQAPIAIAVDHTYVYWMNDAVPDASPGSVLRIEKDGGTIVTLASGLQNPGGIALDNTHLYFTDDNLAGGTAPLGAGLFRIPLDDAGIIEVVDQNDAGDGYASIALDGTSVLTGAPRATRNPRIRKSAKDGTPPNGCMIYVAPQSSRLSPFYAAGGGTLLFGVNTGTGGANEPSSVVRTAEVCPQTGGVDLVPTTNFGYVHAITSDQASIYWSDNQHLYALDVDSGATGARKPVTSSIWVRGVVERGAFVYYSTSNSGTQSGAIWRVPKAGGESHALTTNGAETEGGPWSLTMDEDGTLFWANRYAGEVKRLTPPP